jgi:ferrochelatase
VVADWHLVPGFLAALAGPVSERLTRWAEEGAPPEECALQYVAHSLPESFIQKGDPYLDRTRATVQAVHTLVRNTLDERGHSGWLDQVAGGDQPSLSFQSKVGPIAWLGPQIDEEVPRLARSGIRRLFVQPVSFTCEHIETLLELDVELKEQATSLGIVEFGRGAALNLNETWLDSLADHLIAAAFGPEVA